MRIIPSLPKPLSQTSILNNRLQNTGPCSCFEKIKMLWKKFCEWALSWLSCNKNNRGQFVANLQEKNVSIPSAQSALLKNAPQKDFSNSAPPCPETIRATKNQFSLKGPTGKNLGTSACTSHALYSTIALRTAFVQKKGIGSSLLDSILEEGCSRHNRALAMQKKEDGYNFAIDEVIHSKVMPEVKGAEAEWKVLPKNLSLEFYKNFLFNLKERAEKSKNGISSTVMTRGPEMCSMTARKLEDGRYQYHFFDSHGDPGKQSNVAYLQSFFEEKEMAGYLQKRHPFIEFHTDELFDAMGQQNPNAWEINYLTFHE